MDINQQLIRECDERIHVLVKKHSQEDGELKYEVNLLRHLHDPDPNMKAWAEKGLEELRVKRLNAAQQLAGSTAESHPQDSEPVTHPAKVVASINGSALPGSARGPAARHASAQERRPPRSHPQPAISPYVKQSSQASGTSPATYQLSSSRPRYSVPLPSKTRAG